jgi:hypothetical protein
MSRYFICCPKSSEAEERQALSIEPQRRKLTKVFIDRDRLEIAEVLEEDFSAKAPGRPVFDMMMKRVVKGEADGDVQNHTSGALLLSQSIR